jgi:tetratricopeptide (TPR) repeat protein
VNARREYEAARSFAVALEVNKLEADALRELARLSMALGDYENARRLAKSSLRLANDLGLALQQAHSLP